jgi:hypothetical protein
MMGNLINSKDSLGFKLLNRRPTAMTIAMSSPCFKGRNRTGYGKYCLPVKPAEKGVLKRFSRAD